MAKRAYGADLAETVAEVVSGVDGVTLHPGFERLELSHKDAVSLGFVEPSGLWLDTDDESGERHPGRFGRVYRKVAEVGDRAAFGPALTSAVERSERGETWAAMPVMRVTAGLYLGLMNGQADAFNELRRALDRTSKLKSLWRLWEPQNWRPHMLACAAAVLSGSSSAADTAWMAFDRYSWVCPQIAVTLQHVDPDFEVAAESRLAAADACDEVWPRPLDRYTLDAKSRGALATLLGHEVDETESEGARLANGWKTAIDGLSDDLP